MTRTSELSDGEDVAIGEQAVVGRSVRCDIGHIEDTAPVRLDVGNVFADAALAAEFLLQIGRCGEVVGMGMRVEHPIDRETLRFHEIDHFAGRFVAQSAGDRIVVGHAVDDGRMARFRIRHDVGDGRGRLVEEGFHFGVHVPHPGQ